MTVIIPKESNLSQDCGLVLVTYVSTTSNIVFKIHAFCSCGLDIESTAHFLLHCPTYITERRTLLSAIENTDNSLLDLCEPVLIKTLLFGSNTFDTNANTNVLNATIEYVLSTKRFEEPLFQ